MPDADLMTEVHSIAHLSGSMDPESDTEILRPYFSLHHGTFVQCIRPRLLVRSPRADASQRQAWHRDVPFVCRSRIPPVRSCQRRCLRAHPLHKPSFSTQSTRAIATDNRHCWSATPPRRAYPPADPAVRSTLEWLNSMACYLASIAQLPVLDKPQRPHLLHSMRYFVSTT